MTDDYVVATQQLFQDLITKPKLSDKYLRKPPFRFIHDMITNTMKSTGFPQGLFEGDELNGKLIKEKQDKIAWLNKLIKCLESVRGKKLNVKPNKVVAGMEAEFTNEMLQTFASIAIDVANGDLIMENILNEMNNPNKDTETDKTHIDSNDEDWIIKTQQTLGPLIERPRLLDKLLRRPPFRFLHDIIKSLIKTNGYPLQFLDEDKDITNIDIKDGKVKYQFLCKLINIVSATIDEDLSFIDPKNIIAGKKPEDTNYLLTKLANAATRNDINVDKIKKKINSILQNQKKPKPSISNDGKDTARRAAPVMPKLQLDALLQNANEKTPNSSTRQQPIQQVPIQPVPTQQTQQPFHAIQKLQRPRTARRAPPKLKSNVIDEQKQNEVKNNIIIMDNNDNSNNNTFENEDIDDIDDLDELEQNMNNINNINEQQVDDGNNGKLVRDILYAQQSGIKIDTNMRLGTHRKDSAKSVERIENMREMIQKLCQTCLPLGKCIDLVFEDVESINNELLKWKQQIIKNKAKLVQEREKTNKILNPLQQEIENIQQEIQNQHQLILEKKAVLLRNESKTNDMIRKRLLNE